LVPLVKSGAHPNLLLMRTFSKIYGLAGFRVGYGIAHPELAAIFEKIRQPFNINLPAQIAAMAALDDEEHVRRTRENNLRGLQFFARELKRMKLEQVPSAANFVLIRVGDGARVFDELQKRGVIVRPMGGYGLPEWLRISVGTAGENERCVAALKKLLDFPAGNN
jgi:histidinol-phosphate aminotransferase